MVETNIGDVQVDSPQISVNLPAGNVTFIDSIRKIFDDTAQKVMNYDEIALRALFVSLGLGLAMIVIWRRA